MWKNVSAFHLLCHNYMREERFRRPKSNTTFDLTAAAGADRREFEPQIYMWERGERRERAGGERERKKKT